MKTPRDARVLVAVILGIAALCAMPLIISAVAPGWWATEGVYRSDNGSVAEVLDYSAANQGQLKKIAVGAYEHLVKTLATHQRKIWEKWDGTHSQIGTDLRDLIQQWVILDGSGNVVRANGLIQLNQNAQQNHNDFRAITQGELKRVGKLFYKRLDEIYSVQQSGSWVQIPRPAPWRGDAPWTEDTDDDESHSLVNLGQLKRVFAFDLNGDSDGDGKTDIDEIRQPIPPGGVPNDPYNPDSDGDGLIDGDEPSEGSTLEDRDGDGYPDGEDKWPDDSRRGEEVPVRHFTVNNLNVFLPSTSPIKTAQPWHVTTGDDGQISWLCSYWKEINEVSKPHYGIATYSDGQITENEYIIGDNAVSHNIVATTSNGLPIGLRQDGNLDEKCEDNQLTDQELISLYTVLPTNSPYPVQVISHIAAGARVAALDGGASLGLTVCSGSRTGHVVGYATYPVQVNDTWEARYRVFRNDASDSENWLPPDQQQDTQTPHFSKVSDNGNVLFGYEYVNPNTNQYVKEPLRYLWRTSATNPTLAVTDLGNDIRAIAVNDQRQVIAVSLTEFDPFGNPVPLLIQVLDNGDTARIPISELLVWNDKPTDAKDDYDKYFARSEQQIRITQLIDIANSPPQSEALLFGPHQLTHGAPSNILMRGEIATTNGSQPANADHWESRTMAISLRESRYEVAVVDGGTTDDKIIRYGSDIDPTLTSADGSLVGFLYQPDRTTPVSVREIEVLDHLKHQTRTGLVFSKWEGAFEEEFEGTILTPKDNFIDTLTDSFYLRVPHAPPQGVATTKFSMAIERFEEGYLPTQSVQPTVIDPLVALEMEQDPSRQGFSITKKSHILVTNKVDDQFTANAAAPGGDDAEGDRTHKGRIGDFAHFKIETNVGSRHYWASLPRDIQIKRIRLNFVIVRSTPQGPPPILTEDLVASVFDQIEARFAQVGILPMKGQIRVVDPPAGMKVPLSTGLCTTEILMATQETELGRIPLYDDVRLLIRQYGSANPNDIHVFCVNEICARKVIANHENYDTRAQYGLAYTDRSAQTAGIPSLANNVFLSIADICLSTFRGDATVPAHEIGHTLIPFPIPEHGQDNHWEGNYRRRNLMCAGEIAFPTMQFDANRQCFTTDWIGGQLRLAPEQEVVMRTHRLCK